MAVWITRSEPGASRAARVLGAAGLDCLVAPVIAIEPTREPCPGGCYDLAVVVSEHAARLASPYAAWCGAPARDAWRARTVIGIGRPAVQRLGATDESGIEVVCAANAEAVVRMIAYGDAVPPRTLVVKGEGGREIVQEAILDAGGEVEVWNLYRRRSRSPLIDTGAVSAIVCSSAEGVRAAAAAWFAAEGGPTVPLYAPSARVAKTASDAGFTDVRITAGAAPEAVAAALAADRKRHD